MPQRLRLSSDIRLVFASRNVVHGSLVVTHLRWRGDAAPARCAVVAGRKVGGAVGRNRAKRRLRAVLASAALPVGVDVVVVARPTVVDAPYPTLRNELLAHLSRAATRAGAYRPPANREGRGACEGVPRDRLRGERDATSPPAAEATA